MLKKGKGEKARGQPLFSRMPQVGTLVGSFCGTVSRTVQPRLDQGGAAPPLLPEEGWKSRGEFRAWLPFRHWSAGRECSW